MDSVILSFWGKAAAGFLGASRAVIINISWKFQVALFSKCPGQLVICFRYDNIEAPELDKWVGQYTRRRGIIMQTGFGWQQLDKITHDSRRLIQVEDGSNILSNCIIHAWSRTMNNGCFNLVKSDNIAFWLWQCVYDTCLQIHDTSHIWNVLSCTFNWSGPHFILMQCCTSVWTKHCVKWKLYETAYFHCLLYTRPCNDITL